MKRFSMILAVAGLLAVACVASAHPRGGSNFNRGFDAGVRAARGGHGVRNVGPQVTIRRGPLGRIRSIDVR